MATAANTHRTTAGTRKKTRVQVASAQYKMAIKYIISGALILLSIVFMAAYSADLQQKNNTLTSENEMLQAEIDSLNEQINDATSIDKVEKIATEKYGMKPQSAKNYVTIKDNSQKTENLADVIKKEAYN